DTVPQLHYRRGQLQQFLLLARDELFARGHEGCGGDERQPVQQSTAAPDSIEHLVLVAGKVAPDEGEQRLLEREDEACGFAGGEALARTLSRDVLQQLPRRRPGWSHGIVRLAGRNAAHDSGQQRLALLPELRLAHEVRALYRHAHV